jgi:hypothetical protein
MYIVYQRFIEVFSSNHMRIYAFLCMALHMDQVFNIKKDFSLFHTVIPALTVNKNSTRFFSLRSEDKISSTALFTICRCSLNVRVKNKQIYYTICFVKGIE